MNVNYASAAASGASVVSTLIEGNTVSALSSGYAVDCAASPVPDITWKENILYGRQRGVSLPAAATAPTKPNVQPAMDAIRQCRRMFVENRITPTL